MKTIIANDKSLFFAAQEARAELFGALDRMRKFLDPDTKKASEQSPYWMSSCSEFNDAKYHEDACILAEAFVKTIAANTVPPQYNLRLCKWILTPTETTFRAERNIVSFVPPSSGLCFFGIVQSPIPICSFGILKVLHNPTDPIITCLGYPDEIDKVPHLEWLQERFGEGWTVSEHQYPKEVRERLKRGE